MNIVIKQKNLLEKLNYVIRGIDSRNTLPILNCIKLDLTNEGLVLFATDNDKAIKTFITSENIENINETGDAVIEGRLFYEYIKKSGGNDSYIFGMCIYSEDVTDIDCNFMYAGASVNFITGGYGTGFYCSCSYVFTVFQILSKGQCGIVVNADIVYI